MTPATPTPPPASRLLGSQRWHTHTHPRLFLCLPPRGLAAKRGPGAISDLASAPPRWGHQHRIGHHILRDVEEAARARIAVHPVETGHRDLLEAPRDVPGEGKERRGGWL